MFGSQPHSIKITLNKDGTMDSVVEGVQGPSCDQLTKWLEDLGTVEHVEPTADYFQATDLGAGIAIEF